MAIAVRDGRLARGGEPWFPVGVNYHPGSVGVAWLRSWRPAEVAADLAAMAAAGLDCVRAFAYWADIEPSEGRHDPVVVDRLRTFGALAAAEGLGVVLSVPTVWMNGHRFLPPWFGDRDPWRDPVALARAEAAVGAVAGALAGSGAEVLYDLGDEVMHVDARSRDLGRDDVVAWQRRLADAARDAHPGAVVLQANEASAVFARHAFGPDNAAGLDLCGLHGFPLWGPAAIAGHASPLASRLVPFLVRYGRAHAPVLVDEVGAYAAGPEVVAAHLRATLPAAAAAGAAGAIAWSWTDVAAAGIPFDERPSERTTGMVDGAGRPRPGLAALADAAADARRTWAQARWAPAPVALFLPERARTPERTYLQAPSPDGLALFHADVLCARAQLPCEVTRRPAPHHRLVVCPAAGRLTERDIATLEAAVDAGATLLVTLGDPLHGHPGTRLAGATVADFVPGSRHDSFTLAGTTYPLRWAPGARAAVLAPAGATVVAAFADGTPALTRHRVGAAGGEVWLLAAPFEALLDDPDHVDAAPWHRLYRHVAEAAGVTGDLPACPEPDVDLHRATVEGRPVLVAVNHTAAPVTTTVRVPTGAWPDGLALRLGPKSSATVRGPAPLAEPPPLLAPPVGAVGAVGPAEAVVLDRAEGAGAVGAVTS